ncbi:MAG: DUF4369 domain-containing protein, partial [Bacteroidales bacterium]|nr:DUF4369 domain-containing protein [Bacteroidales bacterium]
MKLNTFKVFVLLLLTVVVAGCGNKKNTFAIKGEFRNEISSKIKLYRLQANNAEPIDSVFLDKGNSFELKGKLEDPAMFLLKFFGTEKIYLILHPGEEIEIDIENNQQLIYYIKGSNDNRILRDMMFEQEKTREKISRLSQKYNEAAKSAENISELNREHFDSIYNGILSTHRDYSEKLIRNNIESLVSIFALYQDFGVKKSIPLFDKGEYLSLYSLVDSVLIQKYPNTEAVKALNNDVAQIKERIAYNLSAGNVIKPGNML